jgi:hypothetical protein
LARLYREVEQVRVRLNPAPDFITFASNRVAFRFQNKIHRNRDKQVMDTAYVNLNVATRRTKYINLFVNTKREFPAITNDLADIDTKIVHLRIDSSAGKQQYPMYNRRIRS